MSSYPIMVGHLKLARDKDLPEEWMVNLKMDWTVFNELKKTVDLKYNRKSPVPDPVARLKLVLRRPLGRVSKSPQSRCSWTR